VPLRLLLSADGESNVAGDLIAHSGTESRRQRGAETNHAAAALCLCVPV